MKIITNSFSPQMVRDPNCLISLHELNKDEFSIWSHNAISMVGNQTIADILDIEYNRENIILNTGDVALVVQIDGKVPKNTTELPPGVEIKYYCIKIIDSLIVKKNEINAIKIGSE